MAITTSSIASDPFAVALLEKDAEIEKLRAALESARRLINDSNKRRRDYDVLATIDSALAHEQKADKS